MSNDRNVPTDETDALSVLTDCCVPDDTLFRISCFGFRAFRQICVSLGVQIPIRALTGRSYYSLKAEGMAA